VQYSSGIIDFNIMKSSLLVRLEEGLGDWCQTSRTVVDRQASRSKSTCLEACDDTVQPEQVSWPTNKFILGLKQQ
jgi:hypothetical protein